ncbi:MAG TPA: hemolysin family protein [Candidatus Obscuribacterales bacterium]
MLILINAFFVAAEMALARVRRTRIDHLVDQGSKTAALAQKALKDPDRFISACQLGITFATLALGAVGEKAFAEDLALAIMQLGIASQWPEAVTSTAKAICYILAFSVTAFLQTVFGELLPKTVTFQRAEPAMMILIWPMEAWCWLTAPFLNVLNGFTTFVLRLLNIKEPPRHHFVHSEEELKMLVSASHEEGVLEEEEEEMLHSVFDFSDTIASEVMTPRTDMVCISADSTVRDFVNLALQHGLSRLPIYEEDIDSIFGAVHIRDALRALIEHKESSQVREFARKVLIVPENKNVGDLLTEFKKSKTHMAIVVDEYGGTRGLVTIEDLVEELVGDIADEHEIVEEFVQEQEDGSVLLDAKISLDDLAEKLGLEIEDEEFNTLGGHVFGRLGREPQVGDEVSDDDYIFRVEEADRHRILKIRMIRKEYCPLESADTNGGVKPEGAQRSEQEPPKPLEASK